MKLLFVCIFQNNIAYKKFVCLCVCCNVCLCVLEIILRLKLFVYAYACVVMFVCVVENIAFENVMFMFICAL